MKKHAVAFVSSLALIAGGSTLAACGTSDGTETVTIEPALPSDAVLIDVRMPDEYAAGHLSGAVNIPLEDGSLEAALADLPGDDTYVVYCRTGRRSEIAASLMADAGLDSVVDLGGFDEARTATGRDVITK